MVVFTDGACLGNPGPGGYGAVLIHEQARKELTGGFARTTNNRMELLAAIRALEALLEPCAVVLHSDSLYLVKAMTQGWTRRWQAAGWRRRDRGEVANVDLWELLLVQCARHEVRFVWVRGHDGNRENERCDLLATTAARGTELPPDQGYG